MLDPSPSAHKKYLFTHTLIFAINPLLVHIIVCLIRLHAGVISLERSIQSVHVNKVKLLFHDVAVVQIIEIVYALAPSQLYYYFLWVAYRYFVFFRFSFFFLPFYFHFL